MCRLEVLAPSCGCEDLLGILDVLASPVLPETLEEELGVPYDRSEDIVEIVGDGGRHPTHGLEFLHLEEHSRRALAFLLEEELLPARESRSRSSGHLVSLGRQKEAL